MVKLTGLHYKVKVSSLERYHKVAQFNEGRLFKWEQQAEKARNLGDKYPPKPFIEPFEFSESDYNIKERKFRVRLKDIYLYKQNTDDVTELTTTDGTTYTIKESVEHIDGLFENSPVKAK